MRTTTPACLYADQKLVWTNFHDVEESNAELSDSMVKNKMLSLEAKTNVSSANLVYMDDDIPSVLIVREIHLALMGPSASSLGEPSVSVNGVLFPGGYHFWYRPPRLFIH